MLMNGEHCKLGEREASEKKSTTVNGEVSAASKQAAVVTSTTQWIKARTSYRPKLAIICGTGFSSIADCIDNADVFNYSDVPNFASCTVPGHAGRLVIGSVKGVVIACLQGRVHMYEGHSMWQLTFPVRVLDELGVEILLATNACGALNSSYRVGDLVIMKDHINLPGLTCLNPLSGICSDEFGSRFTCMTDAYDRQLRIAAWHVGRQLGLDSLLHEGVYLVQCGPSYETRAELRMMRTLGADVVGMSTAPEVIVARQRGLRCFGLSLVTNICITEDDDTCRGEKIFASNNVTPEPGANHDEVLSAGRQQAHNIQRFFSAFISEVASAFACQ